MRAVNSEGVLVVNGERVTEYVSNHDNWEKPILPGQGDCQDMMFDPEMFDQQGNSWNCVDQSKGIVKSSSFICLSKLDFVSL